jgi:DNA-binding transcriptional MerR regulator
MGRPRLIRRVEGLTRREIAKQLGCSYSNVRRWHEEGLLPCHKDVDGNYRSTPQEIVEFARKVGRSTKFDGATIARVYRHFLAPGFTLTPQAIAQIVVDTEQHPDTIVSLWEKFRNPIAAAPSREEAQLDRISQEYDEQIAAMDERFGQRRPRGSFIPGEDHRQEQQSVAEQPSGPGLSKSAAGGAVVPPRGRFSAG